MTHLTEGQLQALASRLATSIEVHAPGWTDQPEHDPGVSLVQALAFLAEELASHGKQIPKRSRAAIERAIGALSTLLRPQHTSAGHLTRVRYFAGQLLSAQDFQVEQDYVRAKHRLHNRWLLGAGVVSGLAVTVEAVSSDSGLVVSVEPGVAIAPDGEELVVPDALICALSAPCSSGFVTLRYVERAVPPDLAIGTTESEASRIEESVALEFEKELPNDGVAIARVTCDATGWHLDTDFQPAGTRTTTWPR